MTHVLAIGTRKGLFLARSADGAAWKVEGPEFGMREVPSVGFVAAPSGAAPRLLVGVRSEHWGPTVAHSDDLGETWVEAESAAVRFPQDTDAALERVWHRRADLRTMGAAAGVAVRERVPADPVGVFVDRLLE